MKVGDYVRTEDGHIDKIVKISDEMKSGRTIKVQIGEEDIIGGYKDFVDWFSPSHFIKSRPNIIDLIEEHDVIVIKERSGDLSKYEVEEYEIVDIYSMKTRIKSLGIFIDNHYKSLQEVEPIIKSIVTKEQFSQMEYKVGE